jgi:predicted phosphodiesterase
MRRIAIQGEIVREYIEKYTGKLSKTALSRLILREHPNLFPDVETARSAIRYHTSTSGKKHRQKVNNPITYKLPEPDHCNTKPFRLPKAIDRLVVLGDIHIPYHDTPAVVAAIEYIKREGVKYVFLNGDVLDFYNESSFQKDRKKRDLAQELRDGKEFFQWLRQELPDVVIYFKRGNHEERWERFLGAINPAMLDVEDFQLAQIMRFGELKIIEIDTRGPVMAGRLPIFHGHETGMKSGGVNPARALALKTKAHGLTHHFHRSSKHRTPHFLEGTKVTYSCGCLCNLAPDYMPINEWSHGFADVRINGKDFHVDLKDIEDGKIY